MHESFASERPRNTTLLISMPLAVRFQDGKIVSQIIGLQLYFLPDNTAFAYTAGTNANPEGVVLAPDADFGSRKIGDNIESVQIIGIPSKLTIVITYDYKLPRTDFTLKDSWTFFVDLSSNTCNSRGGDFQSAMTGTKANHVVSKSIGKITCYLLPGRYTGQYIFH